MHGGSIVNVEYMVEYVSLIIANGEDRRRVYLQPTNIVFSPGDIVYWNNKVLISHRGLRRSDLVAVCIAQRVST